MNKIRKISYATDYDDIGKFGSIHKGRCDKTSDKVAIIMVKKTKFTVDFDVLQRSQTHNNVIKYFCQEEKPDSW